MGARGKKNHENSPEGAAEGVGVRHGEAAVEHELPLVAGDLPLRRRICNRPTEIRTKYQHQAYPTAFCLRTQPPRNMNRNSTRTGKGIIKEEAEEHANEMSKRSLTKLRLLNDDGHLERRKDCRPELAAARTAGKQGPRRR